ncbi:glutathionylspermidine synthase family protein [Methylobacterium oxalidis]|uniref:glutathionylspermidine synthase family protein n=1 Tax=Methylobacterium oxalidis TaxID=944322 RepID=UPI0033158536
MRRLRLGERPDWRETARHAGFHFHSLGGAPYWDESHAYAFGLDAIEQDLEGPAAEIHALCLDFVDRAIRDEVILASLGLPEAAWDIVRTSWLRGDPSLYGRMDFSYGGEGQAKFLEYNADTPTALYESAVFQWLWLEQMLEAGRLPRGTDQFNALHERLIDRFRAVTVGGHVAFACAAEAPEDRGTVAYLEDCALQAGLATRFLDLPEIGLDTRGRFVDPAGQPIRTLFKLYPWEWAFRDAFGPAVARSGTRFLEPPWKALLSNKGLLPHLHRLAPGHPNLLPAFFVGDASARELGGSYVRKPLLSREGANVRIVRDGSVVEPGDGPYGAEGHVVQALAELPDLDGRRPVLGVWLVGDEPAGLCVREDAGPVTTDGALFVPHLILA